ncbi:MAG: divergent polysaccharide deacetylase family protein [Deltaproteobacteria bacterium]|nr:divergent polysaccharide deacetylase family protein [Deltaproteobacteria bacterium]
MKQAAKKAGTAYKSAFEENNWFDQQIKRIDQAIFRILGNLSIPEEDIHYTELTYKKSQAREWHLATIDVRLPPGMNADQFTEKLTPALAKLSIHPNPKVTKSIKGGITNVTLSVNGLSTHVLRLLAPEKASLPPVSPVPAIEGRKPKVAIVIDDLGQDMRLARCFLKIDAPIAFAILPFQPHSERLAREVHEAGQVVMLHLPMEPKSYPGVNPGPGALFRTMDRSQIEEAVYKAIAEVPYISGVNNHMGSSFTEDSERMRWVLETLQKQGLFFLDSRTSARTKSNHLAGDVGIKIAERSVFLDNVLEEEAIRVQLRRLVTLARQKGQAIAIGHPYNVTCRVLTDEFNYLTSKVELVPVTSLVH